MFIVTSFSLLQLFNMLAVVSLLESRNVEYVWCDDRAVKW